MNFQKIEVKRNDGSVYAELSVAQFNYCCSHIIIDDGCYQIVNGDKVSSHIFAEARDVLAKLPNPKELQYSKEYTEMLQKEKI